MTRTIPTATFMLACLSLAAAAAEAARAIPAAKAAARARAADHRLGEHPAVIVKRMAAQARYDYASQFYPHPAWLYLLPAPPDELAQHAAPPAMPTEPPGIATVAFKAR